MIAVEWSLEEPNVVIWKFTTPWTFNEFHAAKERVDAMIDGVEGLVDSIFLTTAEQRIPPSAVAHLRKIIEHQHKRHRYIVVVGAKSFLVTIIGIINQLFPNIEDENVYK